MRIADYTTRKSYQDNYRKANRGAINARKKAWRAKKKRHNYQQGDFLCRICGRIIDDPIHIPLI